ncbi:MAG: hypothetical protein D6790_03350 [Caldilineae bacterium]|nr:MAG: hypothetical protein D6790_03350 [Caldilineae bacterium]
MKRELFYQLILTVLLVLAAFFASTTVALLAQTASDTLLPPPNITPDMPVEVLVDYSVALYTALVVLLGYLSAYIPGLNKVAGVQLRVLVVAAVTALIFITLGFAKGWQLVLAYLTAALGYDKLLSPFFKTPKTEKDLKKKAAEAVK